MYSIFRHGIAEGEPVTTLSRETELSLQASNIFEGGVLIGKGTDRHTVGNYDGAHDSMQASLPKLRKIADDFGATLSQLAFAYPLTNPLVANALVGLRTLEQYDDLVGAFEVLERVGAKPLREAVSEFWYDRNIDPTIGGEGPED